MDIKYIYKSHAFKVILLCICALIVALVIFQAGIFVGFRKASFSYGFGDRYHQTFGDMHRGMMGFSRDDLSSGHGAAGKIIRVTLPTFMIATQDNLEKSVLIDKDTVIRRFRDTISSSEIKTDDIAVVIGAPNAEGQIVAKFIRLMPPPTSSGTYSNAASTTSATSTKK